VTCDRFYPTGDRKKVIAGRFNLILSDGQFHWDNEI